MFENLKQYAIELDGETFSFSERRLEQIHDLDEIKGDMWLVSDMKGSISGAMTVEAPAKYAEVTVRRRLQETGEFDEPVSIITHWKKKKGKNTTDIFFTALPTRIRYQYFDWIREHEDSVALFPLFSVLYSVLKKLRPQEPVAVIFQHNRFADLIIGTKKRVYYANRCVAFDESEDQVFALWDTVRKDIKAAETENRIKVTRAFNLSWLKNKVVPEWPEEMKSEFYSIEDEIISYGGEEHRLSFLKAAGMMSGTDGIAPGREKIFYYAQRFAPYLNGIFFLGAILLLAGFFWYNYKVDALKRDLTIMDKRKSEIRMEISHEIPQVPYKEILAFVQDLAYCHNAPSFKEVINDISDALSAGMKVNILKMDYSTAEVMAEIFGKAEISFDTAYMGYQTFEKILKAKGYVVDESKFNTEISSSEFLIKIRKKIR